MPDPKTVIFFNANKIRKHQYPLRRYQYKLGMIFKKFSILKFCIMLVFIKNFWMDFSNSSKPATALSNKQKAFQQLQMKLSV